MLAHLNIQGLAIIDSLDIDFETGFNVITGETGAGKSILIKALGLLLGVKANSDTVRSGAKQAQVCGTFVANADHPTRDFLAECGVPLELYGPARKQSFDIIIRRTVSDKGRSQAWINDTPVTVTRLKEFSELLIDVFAQHESHRMLDPVLHLTFVDQFLKSDGTRKKYHAEFEKMTAMDRKLREMVEEYRSRSRDSDYIEFRTNELNEFDPSEDEYVQIVSVCDGAKHSIALSKLLTAAQVSIDGDQESGALSARVWDAVRQLKEAVKLRPDLEAVQLDSEKVAEALDSLSFDLGKHLNTVGVDEDNLEQSQSRLAGYQELFRKMHVKSYEDFQKECDALLEQQNFLQNASQEIKILLKDMVKQASTLRSLATTLSKERAQASTTVQKRIEKELHELAMPAARFGVEFSPVKRSFEALDLDHFGDDLVELYGKVVDVLSETNESGAERAQFMFAPNKGESYYPVHKIASGGEVSRIMLAFKKALVAGADTCILVFDEIDTGISGRVADVVGKKMKSLADHFQVICISHLAQVAAYGEAHFKVQKVGKGKRTESTLVRLSAKESVEEVARLLSGDEITKSSLANARELMKSVRS